MSPKPFIPGRPASWFVLILSLCCLPSPSLLMAQDLQVFYTNDFSDCSDFTFTNANDDLGLGQFLPGITWECSTVGPEGAYAISPIASTTADNGFMMVDSDEFGGPDGGGATSLENCYFTLNDVLDLTGHELVSIEWENYYRQYTDQELCLLEVSLDGVTWPADDNVDAGSGPSPFDEVVEINGEVMAARYEIFPGFGGNTYSANPYVHRVNLGEAFSNASQLHIRFRWVGSWGYSWMIDDLRVLDTPENDLGFYDYLSITDYETTGLWEARTWPVSQLPAFDLAARVTNVGSADQTGATLSVAVNGSVADGGFSQPMTLAANSSDTLRVTGWTPPGMGEYVLDFSVASDVPDQYPSDNVAQDAFEVVEYQYGRDNGQIEGEFPGDGTVDYIAAVPYDAINDMTIYAIDVAIMDGSDVGADVVCLLFDYAQWAAGSNPYDGLMAVSAERQIQPDMLNSGEGDPVWTTFVFEEPITVGAGGAVLAAFEHLGGDNVQVGTSIDQAPQTIWVYGPFGSFSEYAWYWTSGSFMVRLNLDPAAACLGCVDPAACNYDPSACGDDGSCLYAYGCDFCAGGGVVDGDTDNDGVCNVDEVPGCTDPGAWNYDPNATDPLWNSCIYVPQGCGSIGNDNWGDLDLAVFPEFVSLMYGVSATEELVLNVPATMVEPGSGSVFSVQDFTPTSVSGLPPGVELDWPDSPLAGGNQACIALSGAPAQTGYFTVTWTGDVVLSLFGSAFPIGEYTFVQGMDVVPNPNPIPGCTYPGASNYMLIANDDDGSCLIEGCTDPQADNYHPIFNADDGSCSYGGTGGGDGGPNDCPSDLNGDDLIGVADLLILLGEFGVPCL